MGKRKALSKTQRFRVFDRDGFVCRYCGESPPEVRLVVDHVIPVVDGGTNDDENLITSCNSCNQGKGAKPLSAVRPDANSPHRAQELLERIDFAELLSRATTARSEARQSLIDYWCHTFGVDSVPCAIATRLLHLGEEFDGEAVLAWIDIAAINVPRGDHTDRIKYINGIAKKRRRGCNE